MDIHSVRQQLKTCTIYDLPPQVTFYARVSSESVEQLNSLGNQIQYYQDLISKNKQWTFVECYIDEVLSAATTKNRRNKGRVAAVHTVKESPPKERLPIARAPQNTVGLVW